MFTFICIIAYGLSFVTIFLITKFKNPLILLNLSVILISQLEHLVYCDFTIYSIDPLLTNYDLFIKT